MAGPPLDGERPTGLDLYGYVFAWLAGLVIAYKPIFVDGDQLSREARKGPVTSDLSRSATHVLASNPLATPTRDP